MTTMGRNNRNCVHPVRTFFPHLHSPQTLIEKTNHMKLSTLALSALVAFGGAQTWAQTNKLATVGIVTGTVTITDRVGTPTNRPGTVNNNLAGMAYVAGNVPGAVDTSVSFFTLDGVTVPSNPADMFTSYGTLISPTAVGSYPDVAGLVTANSYSGLTFAIDDLGLPIAGTFYTIHHKNSGDYFANIVPKTGGLSSTADLKPMSWQGGVAGGPSNPGLSGYFGLAYATGAVSGYAANSMFYLRTDGASHTQFGVMIPALTGGSTDKLDLTTAVGSFGVGGYTTLAYSPVAFGGYAANQFYYLRSDSVTGYTILGRLDPSLVPGTRTISDIANLGGVFNTLNYAFDATGPSGSWGLSQLYATGGRTSTAQSISFPAIADRAISSGSFTVTPSASSGLALTLSVVAGSTGAASITGPVAGVFTVKPLAPGVITLEAKQSGGAFDTNLLRQSFNATGTATLAITTQPTSQTGVAGSTVNFSVVASGTAPLSYQWRKAGVNIASATAATLTLTNVQAADAATYDVVVSNGAIPADTLASSPVTLTVTTAAPIINSSLSAAGTIGTAFSYSITASNGPTSYSASPLPAGLAINTGTGAITGTPTTAGTTSVLLGATNTSGTGNATLTITVTAAGVAPVITNTPLTAGGTVGTAFSFGIIASNSPTSYSATPLPAGLTVNTATGAITGTPAAAGTTSVLLGATNATGTGNATLTITVAAVGAVPVINNSPLTAPGTVGTPFSFTITAAGSPTSFSASPLPAGLSIVAATGAITGTPTTVGTTSVLLGATNANGTGNATLTITVAASSATPIITISPFTAAGTVGTPFNFQITATGLPTSFFANVLPPGLSLNTVTGVITGTPTVDGVTAMLISATNGNGVGRTADLTVTIGRATAAPIISNAVLTAAGTIGTPFSYLVTATGSPTIYSASPLPPGLSIVAATGAITGTPTTAGTTVIVITATNAFGTSTTTVTATVAAATVAPVITSPATSPGTVGSPIVPYVIVATGLPTSYTATGLPPGLSINSSTGVINGTPTTAGTYTVTTTATNSAGSSSTTVTFIVGGASATPIITSPVFATGAAGTPFVTYLIAATGIPTSYTATGLAPGLIVNPLTGAITGTPAAPGNYVVTITATNANGTSTASLLITVGPNLSSRIMNFSARAISGPGDQSLIMGFVVSGNNKNLLVRGIGPSLAQFGVTNPLADPLLTLYNSSGPLATNDDWSVSSTGQNQAATIAATTAQVGGFALPAGSKDSALLFMVNDGAHTSGLVRPNSTTGVALTEIYDTDTVLGARIINVSARMNVTGGQGTLVAGFVIGGTVPKTVLIRAIGPTLTQFGVAGALPDPQIAVYAGSTQVAFDDNWETGTSTAAQISSASAQVGAFALPAGSKDAALLLTLQPGAYTVLVSGGTATGIALVEVYDTQ